jgi:hypothetical protein
MYESSADTHRTRPRSFCFAPTRSGAVTHAGHGACTPWYDSLSGRRAPTASIAPRTLIHLATEYSYDTEK